MQNSLPSPRQTRRNLAQIIWSKCCLRLSKINLRKLLIDTGIILALVLVLTVQYGHAQSRVGPATPVTLEGAVVRVIDGDTVVVRVSGRNTRIRLARIDAPESRQSHGRESSAALGRKVAGKNVQVMVSGTDRHGRTVGVLMLGGRDINLAMVQNGHAWHFESRRAHAVGVNEGYAAAQRSARLARKGLWAQANPVEPWEWRN